MKTKACRKRISPVFSILIVLISVNLYHSLTEAGGLTGSIERSIAKKSGQRTAVKALEKRAAGAALTSAERAALRRELVRLDRQTLELIERRYRLYIHPERLSRSKQMPIDYIYEKPPNGRLGYYDSRPHVYTRDTKVPTTVAHERLHNLSNPEFRTRLGANMDEGVTEFFTQQIRHDIPINDGTSIYSTQQRVINMFAARVGEKPLAKAYFQGDISQLQGVLDRKIGRGQFNKLIRAIDADDYVAAEWILKGGR